MPHRPKTRPAVPKKVKRVPTVRLTCSFMPAPVNCEMMTCPALEKPIDTKAMKCITSPPMEAAPSPSRPTKWPTTIMSVVL